MKKKKQYLKPKMEAYEIEPENILAASPGSEEKGEDEDPGDLYDEIEIGEGYADEFD